VGVPLISTLTRAGSVSAAATTAVIVTLCVGTRCLLTSDHHRWPGTARSRLKANVIREADVRQDVAQKNCAEAEISRTMPAQLLSIAWLRR